MSGAESVLALVMIEWTAGWLGGAAWTQSWKVVRRGHFRITAWIVLFVAIAAALSLDAAVDDSVSRLFAYGLAGASALYLASQYLDSDVPGVLTGATGATLGLGALIAASRLVDGWPFILAAVALMAGAAFVGAVTNGMMLGHWYLNQPGLKPWALARLTRLAVAGVIASAIVGAIAAPLLLDASTAGAVLGLPGFGESFAPAFFGIWIVLLGFTAWVVWAARRCIKIRSIQSATGLYYVAILTAGVAEFLLRYLMVNAT